MDQITFEVSFTKVIYTMELEQSLILDNFLFEAGFLNFKTYYLIFIITTPNNVIRNITTEISRKLYTYIRVCMR